MKIAVICANGKAGKLIVEEAAAFCEIFQNLRPAPLAGGGACRYNKGIRKGC